MEAGKQRRGGGWMRGLLFLALLGGAILGIDLLLSPGPTGEVGEEAATAAPDDRPGGLAGLWRRLSGETPTDSIPSVDGGEVAAEVETPTVPLIVRVIGPEGPEPAAGATVFLDDAPLGITGADGRLATTFPLDGESHDAWGELGEHRAEAYRLYESNLPAGELLLVLRGAGTVKGLVLDPEGKPAPNVEVSIEPAAADPRTTGAGGTFTFEGLPEGGYQLQASTKAARAESYFMVLDSEEQKIVIHLEPHERLAGRVVDEAGAPLSEMEVTVIALFRGGPGKTRTDDAGRFEQSVVEDREVMVNVRGQGRKGFYEGWPRADLEIIARKTTALIVELRYPDGEPAVGVSLELFGKSADGSQPRGGQLEPLPEPGDYRAENLEPGTWSLREQVGFDRSSPELASITLTVGEEQRLRVVFPGGAKRLQGQVLEADGRRPVPGARVSLGSNEEILRQSKGKYSTRATITDAEGRFTFERTNELDRSLWVTAEGFHPRGVVGGEGESLEILLDPERRIRGVVVDEKRLPLMDFRIDQEAHRASDGVFDRPLPVEAKEVKIGAWGHATVRREFSAGSDDVELGEVVLETIGLTRVRVLAPDGSPALGARVLAGEVRDTRGWTPSSSQTSAGTDREGWTLLGLAAGRYGFEAKHPDHGSSGRQALVREVPSPEPIVLQLQPAAWIFGHAGGPDRQITVWPEGISTRSRPDGSYRIGPLSASRPIGLMLREPRPGQPPRERQAPRMKLEPGEERRYDFDDPGRGRVVVGCDLEVTGMAVLTPLPAEEETEPRYVVHFFPRYDQRCPLVFEDVDPGAYRLSFQFWQKEATATPPDPRELTVEAGATTELSVE